MFRVTTCKVGNWQQTILEGKLSPNSVRPFDVIELVVNDKDVKVELNLYLKMNQYVRKLSPNPSLALYTK